MQTPEEVAREASCEVSWNAAEDWICHTHESAWQDEDAWCPGAADVIRARDAEVEANVLRSLSYEWGNTFNDYRTNENIVIYTSPSRQLAIERAENSSGLIAVQRRVSEWETIKPEDEDE